LCSKRCMATCTGNVVGSNMRLAESLLSKASASRRRRHFRRCSPAHSNARSQVGLRDCDFESGGGLLQRRFAMAPHWSPQRRRQLNEFVEMPVTGRPVGSAGWR
jgi:hypothetical protein